MTQPQTSERSPSVQVPATGDPCRTSAWQQLQAHAPSIVAARLDDMFAGDPRRAERFALTAAGIHLDYAKQRVDATTLALLVELARQCRVEAWRDAMFAGAAINSTESRAVLHVALREPGPRARRIGAADAEAAGVADDDILSAVHDTLDRFCGFAEQVRDGTRRGHDGRRFTDVVNIGIGGSDLGPLMVCDALRPDRPAGLNVHFVSNVDGAHLDAVLARVAPATTLFIVASKTFTTSETMTNAHSARDWLRAGGVADAAIGRHFAAVSTNAAAVTAFGIDADCRFGFWDWVGGRYSLWSAIGLSIAIAIGAERFRDLLAGAHAMDRHFQTAPLAQNMPVLMALLGVWNVDFLGASSLCVAPYAQDLHRLPAFLQQLEMESNGKSIDRDGQPVGYRTCPVIWGEPGTNGQHAFFQLLHQGTELIPVDFILAMRARGVRPHHQRLLIANCLAQSEALMNGRRGAELAPHKRFSGNRPSSTIVIDELDAHALGALLALYEHKVFVQGVIWNINSFDQWGVELGKQLAGVIDAELRTGRLDAEHDGSTVALMRRAIAAGGL